MVAYADELVTAIVATQSNAKLVATCVRAAYRVMPDPCGLMKEEVFTLLELRALHEAVLGTELARDHFRRVMEPQLVATGERASGRVGKPARTFRMR